MSLLRRTTGVEADLCTGVLVVHDDGTSTCLDDRCADADPRRHDWRGVCVDLIGGCADCAPVRRATRSHRRAA